MEQKATDAETTDYDSKIIELEQSLDLIVDKIKDLKRQKSLIHREIDKVLKAKRDLSNPKIKQTRNYVLYSLLLMDSKYYVGITKNMKARYKRHAKGKGSWWTKEYAPIQIIELRETFTTIESEAAELENRMTLEYAETYGKENVRGGGYCQKYPDW